MSSTLRQRTITYTLIVIGFPLIILIAILTTGWLQRNGDGKTLKTFVQEDTRLGSLGSIHPKNTSQACETVGNQVGKCVALEYPVNESMCAELMANFNIKEKPCNTSVNETWNERDIVIRFGSTYESAQSHVTVIMNEANLLWKYW
jgi:hypothetical protein